MKDQPQPTKERLWFLYCAAGCTKSGIQDFTGWRNSQIDYGLRKWRLHMYSPTYAATAWNDELLNRLAGRLGVVVGLFADWSDVRDLLQQNLAEQNGAAGIDWAAIDALGDELTRIEDQLGLVPTGPAPADAKPSLKRPAARQRPAPRPGSRDEMNRRRLWYLACFLGLLTDEIASLTGWLPADIVIGFEVWHFGPGARVYRETDLWINTRLRTDLGLPLTPEATRLVERIRELIRDDVRQRLRHRALDWSPVDALPWLEEIEAAYHLDAAIPNWPR